MTRRGSPVKSVHLTYVGGKDGDYADQVIVGRKGMPAKKIGVSVLPNETFLPLCSRTRPPGRA